MSRKAVRCLVSGRVQGVYYRGWTAEQARPLRIEGWARNLSDGRVEVVAAGERADLSELAERLWQGPPAARVEGVSVEDWTDDGIGGGFQVR